MKRFLFISLLMLIVFACSKTSPDVVYDTHLFQQLQAHNWIFDSARGTDSVGIDTLVYPSDTAAQVTQFGDGLYIIRTVRDTIVLDSTIYQAIYDSPDKIYYYSVGDQIYNKQYLVIDTVNEKSLVLNKMDTLKNTSVNYYHAQ